MAVTPELHYRDPHAAVAWLERAFGLEIELLVSDAEGALVFARMTGPVGIVPEGPGRPSPVASGGVSTHTLELTIEEDADRHCARARAAGARILIEPRQEFYGARNYVAADVEGHLWCFSQRTGEAGPPPEGWSIVLPKGPRRA